MCDYKAVCHQAERSSAPRARDDLRFVPPPELRAGDRVTFSATVVRDYSHWWAFEQTFTAGLDDPAQIRPQGDAPCCSSSSASVPGDCAHGFANVVDWLWSQTEGHARRALLAAPRASSQRCRHQQTSS